MKNFIIGILFLAVLWTSPLQGQTQKITFLEHYSNTKCPNCQNSRPKFYTDMMKYEGEVNHMTIHYKYPYSSCPLYLYNKSEADNRVAVYEGSNSPVQGAPWVYVNSIRSSTSQFENKIEQAKEDNYVPVGLNMVEKGTRVKEVTLEVANLTDATMEDLFVYAALVEKKVNINVDNEDWEIHDVFRKFLGDQEGKGDEVGVLNAGEKKEIKLTGEVPSDLEPSDLYVLSWVEQRVPDGDKYNIIMHNSVSVHTSTTTTAELKIPVSELSIYPNPARDFLHMRNSSDFVPNHYRIISSQGKEIKRMNAMELINISDLTPGNYFLIMENKSFSVSRKFIKQ